MGLAQLVVPFLATWFGIHAFLFLLQRFLNRPNLPTGPGGGQDYELLPTTSSASSGAPSTGSSKASSSSISSGLLIQPFHVRFSTTGLNSFFFRLGNSPKLARFWRIWYNLGVGFGLLAMVFGWALLAYAAVKLIMVAVSFLWTLWPLGSSSGTGQGGDGTVSPSRFGKRDLPSGDAIVATGAADVDENDMVFVPIPGVTLPLSHLPYYLIALLVSGVYHEAGHAIAAAREKTQISSTGIFLYILYPGAFVDISPRALAALTPLQQLRVICAGVWHNAVLFAAAGIFLASGALQLSFQLMGWRQMTDGLSVVDVTQGSPLADHLKVGWVIHKVDDTPLSGDPLEIWSNILLSDSDADGKPSSRNLGAGFCVPKNILFVNPSDCCLFTPQEQFGHSQNMSLSCFTPFDPLIPAIEPFEENAPRILAKDGQCLTSVEVLLQPDPLRCSSTSPSCGDSSLCYRPFHAYSTAAMARIHVSIPSWMELPKPTVQQGQDPRKQIVLYQGDPKDIWDTVRVTNMGVRWSFLPLGLPNAVFLTIRYTMSFSLALSVLNIVPARHLDGHHALKAMVALGQSLRHSYKSTQSVKDSLAECLLENGLNMGAMSSISTSAYPKGARAVKVVVVGTTVLLGGVMAGSLLQMIASFF